jgi:hypothetical protein
MKSKCYDMSNLIVCVCVYLYPQFILFPIIFIVRFYIQLVYGMCFYSDIDFWFIMLYLFLFGF